MLNIQENQQNRISILNRLLTAMLTLLVVGCSDSRAPKIISEVGSGANIIRTVELPVMEASNKVIDRFISNEIVPFKQTDRYPGENTMVVWYGDSVLTFRDVELNTPTEGERMYHGVYHYGKLTFLINKNALDFFRYTNARERVTYQFHQNEVDEPYDPYNWWCFLEGDDYHPGRYNPNKL